MTAAFGALKGKTTIIDGSYVDYTPNPDFTFGTDTFTYTVDDGHGASVSESVTVTMVQVSDWWGLQSKDSDGIWNASPTTEVSSHEDLRWKPTYGPTPPNGLTSITWIRLGRLKITTLTTSSPPLLNMTMSRAGMSWPPSTNVGIWAILPQINFAPPHQ